jgi:hypothetical protein
MNETAQEQLQGKCTKVICGTYRQRHMGTAPNHRLQRTRKLAAEPNR